MVGPNGSAQASFTGAYTAPSTGTNFDLLETFSSVNAPSMGLSSVQFSITSTLGVTVQIIANGTSTYSATYGVDTVGTTRSINYSSFSNPAVFGNLTSLEFIETFPGAGGSGPSVGFTGPILLAPAASVPEPASLTLCGLAAGLGLVGTRLRRKSVAQ